MKPTAPLSLADHRLLELVWDAQPVSSAQLCKLAADQMEPYKLGEMEGKLADLIWAHVPVSTRELIGLCAEAFGWKRTTTYTVIKRLSDKGYLKNEAAVVTALVDRAEVQRADGQEVLQRSFHGSLPSFLAAFLQAGTVTDQEAAEIEEMLAAYRQRH